MASHYRQQMEDWLGTLHIACDYVLDIGAGQGTLPSRVGKWSVDKYDAWDLPDYDITDLWPPPKQRADIIFCLEVFEYIIDPITAMRNIANYLADDGRAYVTFQFIYPCHYDLASDSLRYTQTAIEKLADKVGLKIDNIIYRVASYDGLVKFFIRDGIKLAESVDHNVMGYIVEFVK